MDPTDEEEEKQIAHSGELVPVASVYVVIMYSHLWIIQSLSFLLSPTSKKNVEEAWSDSLTR
jgi:hypothetical protein